MNLFYDTSAIVPLLVKEVHTDQSLALWGQAESIFAW